jgi:energy-coupling factor transport system permease protein
MDLLRSLPIGLYLEQPVTWLHKVDPRVKLAWLMTFLLAPLLANPLWRLGLVGLLLILSFLVFFITCITPDGLGISHQPRLPSESLDLAQPTSYHYVLFDRGRIIITRRSLDVAIRIATLVFTLIYSTNLYLLTTAPEEITAGLEDLMSPLRWFQLPVGEIALTLTLSLRFIPLVLEEIQNLVRSIRTRAIDWKKLGVRRSLQLWAIVAERLLANLLLRAEQIAIAMDVRGFTTPNEHKVQWHQLRLRWLDWIVLGSLIPFWLARWSIGQMF